MVLVAVRLIWIICLFICCMTDNVVKRLRCALGMSQAAFSAVSGVPKRTLENWEVGRNTPPDYVVKLLIYWVEHQYGVKVPLD